MALRQQLCSVEEKEHIDLDHPLHNHVLDAGHVFLLLLLGWHYTLAHKLALKQPYLFVITHL